MDMDDSLYNAYKDAGRSASLVLMMSAEIAISLAGILFNSALICVTLRAKSVDPASQANIADSTLATFRSLYNTTSWLLGITAACDVVTQASHFITFCLLASGRNFIDWLTCYRLQFPAALTYSTTIGLTFFIAADRLLSITRPVVHTGLRKRHYLVAIFAFCFAQGLVLNVFSYLEVATNEKLRNRPVVCSIGECYTTHAGNFMPIFTLSNCIGASLCYVALWRWMAKHYANQDGSKQSQIDSRQIFRALAILQTVIVICYIGTGMLMFVGMKKMDSLHYWFFSCGLAWFINLAIGATAPILYLTSTEYRNQFRALMAGIFAKLGTTRHTQTATVRYTSRVTAIKTGASDAVPSHLSTVG